MSVKDIKTVILQKDHQKIKEDFGEKAEKSFKNKVEKKRNEIKQVNTFNQARRRFYKSFSQKGTSFTELQFTSENKSYRSIFLVDGKTKSFVYIDTLCKEKISDNYRNSIQNKLLTSVSNSKSIVEAARDKCLKYVEA